MAITFNVIVLILLVSRPSFAFIGPIGHDWFLTSNIVGSAFYSAFDWEDIVDPTHGRVNYVDELTSIKRNLTYATFDSFILQADHKTVLDPGGPGRDSVRIISKKAYTQHIAIFDVRHMPQGCGTWPAIWETRGKDWPTGGEIDILEGVNDQSPNRATIHTTEGCVMPASRLETGTPSGLDCNWLVNFNQGCSVLFPTKDSYGPDFNANGGGWFALERTHHHLSVWFWPRDYPTVPWEIKYPVLALNSANWGTPAAYFPDTSCDLNKYFAENNIIINLTFCGDWAGNAYTGTGCPSTCVDYVNNNPAAFTGAYFDIGSIRVYEPPPF